VKIEEIRADRIDSGGSTIAIDKLAGKALPWSNASPTYDTELHFHAISNFVRTFAFKPDDRLVFLTDRLLDPRVVAAITGLAAAQGVKAVEVKLPTTGQLEIPDAVKPVLEQATFVVSSWFCSAWHPYCIDLRRRLGQRWVKITFFRNLDLLHTPQARFPTEIVGELIRRTAARIPRGVDYSLKFTDRRGSDLTIPLTARMTDRNLDTNRWRGENFATSPGAYVHYLPTHGPNLYEPGPMLDDPTQHHTVKVTGTIYSQWAVGFEKPFTERIGVRFENNSVVEVTGSSPDAVILRDMLMGGILIELGCGFGAVIRTKLPYVGSVGALDMVNFAAPDSVPEQYRGRKLYPHNPQVTLMRTTAEENARIGRWIGERLNLMEGPVRFLIPEGGVSALDAPGQPFHDPNADAALFDALAGTVRSSANRKLIRLPHHINDPAFAQALVREFLALHQGRRGAVRRRT